ncbi:MAG: insulinase family protein [Tissierellia bacterium]|nr:insulinase family protein [Tissierellia bacterium]
MNFEVNKIYYGFKLLEEHKIDEIESIGRVFYHEKSGARLLHIENGDNNKVFSIGFRTPPSDSTGVPHIIEHCVLSGSRKYTTKEPFMDMVKGSLQTFINAMTYSDKTLYPVASRNEKDLFNLMDVYLDAVFYPKIYDIPEIFMQEGWHYELFDKEDDIQIKGVVYNEMQGAYSSPERILVDSIDKSLYPDTPYQYSSGGNPDVIPQLTYEDFLDFHRKYYHPSNSYIYLYGNGNIEEQLDFIDKNYLSNFNRIKVDSNIKIQKPFTQKNELEAYYHISQEESDKNRTYLSLNFVLGQNIDLETYLMNSILGPLLIDSPAAPLKKALLDAGIGEDIFSISTGGLQPSFGIVAKNTSIDKKEEFEKIIFDTLNNLIEQGIDKKLIQACVNMVEYDLREASRFPTKGIIYNIQSLDSWLYDGSPVSHLQYEKTLNQLRKNIDTGYFENFIKEHIVNNTHSSSVTISPKKGLADKKAGTLKEALKKYKNSLTEEEINALIHENNRLKEIQLSDDSPEAKASIPKLSLSDVDTKSEIIPQDIMEIDDITFLYHNIFTSKIGYLDIYFDISMIDEELIPYINILAGIIGKIDTETKSYSELSNEIYSHTGGIDLGASVYMKYNRDDVFHPKFIVSGKAIGNNIIKLLELISELILESKIKDEKRIKELLQQMKSRIEMSIFNKGHSIASRRVSSYFSPSRKYLEKLNGLDFYWFLSHLLDEFDSNSQEILSNLNKVYNMIFNKNNLIISFTGDEDDFSLVKNNLNVLTGNINNEKLDPVKYNFSQKRSNEGILSSANVQYVSKGYNFKRLGYDFNGSMRVLTTILNGDYLHNRIRAQGGAYGAGILVDRTGHLTTFSYRDPNLDKTLLVYNNMGDYIENLELSKEELTTYIIGTISRLDPATTPHMKGQIATNRYISNTSQEDVQKIRDQVLNTKLEDIKAFAPVLKDTMEENYLCVLGNENKIKENKKLFNELVPLKK